MDFNNFDWGSISGEFKKFIENESITSYIKVFDVEKNDIVVDFGAFVGSFTYGILDRNPEHVWVLEPGENNFRILYKNLKNNQVSFTRAAISDQKEIEMEWWGGKNIAKGITFKDFVDINCIDKIDFFKCDCEGGEYLIFNEENLYYLKNKIKKIVVEFHIEGFKEQFTYFRDNILKNFDKFYIFAVDGVDIKWDLYNDHFVEYYKQILIHIDNRK